jgi:hypothetical protein
MLDGRLTAYGGRLTAYGGLGLGKSHVFLGNGRECFGVSSFVNCEGDNGGM